jgi:2-polyprenyl-3-methyl-5-hydroxy-6-metoxy-1,4-benzoquinol methylase
MILLEAEVISKEAYWGNEQECDLNKATVQYYDNSAEILVGRYESAQMTETRNLLLRHIPCGKRVLEIGCGSGRDAAFLLSKGFQVVAIDPSNKMVAAALQRHPELQGHLFCSGMPLFDGNPLLNGVFDAALAIATIMHMTDSDLVKSASQLQDMISPDGLLMVSSSIGRKNVIESRDSCV